MIFVQLCGAACAALWSVTGLQSGEGVEALVARVQENLAAIDRALAEAADAPRAASPIERARQGHLAAIRDLEELIKSVKYQRSPESRGGGGQPPPQGDSPSGSSPPRSSDGQSAPQPPSSGSRESETPPPSSSASGENRPQDGEAAGGEPRPDPSDAPPPPSPTDRFLRTDTDARWGVLPPKLQEQLLNLHVDDVPERYRAFLDAYVRAVNRQESP